MSGRRIGPFLASGTILLILLIPREAAMPWAELPLHLVELLLLLALICVLGRAALFLLLPVLLALALLKAADLVTQAALGRSFNPVTDLALLDAGRRLLAGTFGEMAALSLACGAVVAAIAGGLALGLAVRCWAARPISGAQRSFAAAICALVLLPAATAEAPIAGNAGYLVAHAAMIRQSLAELRRLREAAATDPHLGRPGMLGAIDRDVLLIFVESYGRSSFSQPLYARHIDTLRRAETALAEAGLAARSGFFVSPVQGGQSWLAHATAANGLRIADQAAYRAVLASPRRGLFHHAAQAGFRTAAVMPAITRPWPEAERMGFDRVLAAADLGYRGKPFDWVTMPDQFTLTAMDRLLRNGGARPRMMIQIALISSHAPWTPVPRILAWDLIGDGREFDEMAESGDPPAVVWRDQDRVRRSYRDALDYALQAVTGYVLRHAAEAPLVLILGDHPAAPHIALKQGREVPLHVIGPHTLVERTAAWGLAPGLIPPPDAPSRPLEQLRDLILGGFDGESCSAVEQREAKNC
ncbi:sulfatase [Paracoccus ravus]|uniref:sulfatase n=1 Tax=Paracoccus ravus TaxID=2447760 RepID=UPI00106E0E4E|nr:sulfatase [Paracoccus ravus]